MSSKSAAPPGERRCPVCGARVAQRAAVCLMCNTDLSAALPQVELIAPKRRLPWVPMALASAVLVLALAGGGWWLAGRLNAPVPATATSTVTPTPSARPASPTRAPSATPTMAATDTSTPTTIPTPTLPPPIRYTVQSGDTLLGLAQRFNVSVDAIRDANGLSDDTLIAGRDLFIPVPTPTPPAGNAAGTPGVPAPGEMKTTDHVVQAGETLSGIAQTYGVSMQAIQDANHIDDPNSIKPGDHLVIPLGTVTPTPSPTAGPTATATARPQYDAPTLLAPANGAVFALDPQPGQFPADQPFVLQWTSVGLLMSSPPDAANDWYRVTLRNTTLDGPVLTFYTRATSLHLLRDQWQALPPGDTYTFSWEVQVVREVGRTSDGTLIAIPNGRPSGLRTFSWQGPVATKTP